MIHTDGRPTIAHRASDAILRQPEQERDLRAALIRVVNAVDKVEGYGVVISPVIHEAANEARLTLALTER